MEWSGNGAGSSAGRRKSWNDKSAPMRHVVACFSSPSECRREWRGALSLAFTRFLL